MGDPELGDCCCLILCNPMDYSTLGFPNSMASSNSNLQLSSCPLCQLATWWFHSVQFSSFAQLCLTLCDPMDCRMPGFPVHHQLPELTQTHAHWVDDAIQPSHPLSSPFSSCLQSFLASGSFQMSQFFASGGQSVGVSASASILPMNIQDWFPLGWTDPLAVQGTLKSLLFKNINSSALSFVCSPTLTSIHDYWKNQRFDYMDLCWQKVLSLGVTKALHPNIATANSWVSDPQIWPSSRAP